MAAGVLSHGGHLKPFTTDAFSRIMSSFLDRFLVEIGSRSLWICGCEAAFDGVDATAALDLGC